VPSGRMPERSFNCPVQEYPNPILYKNDKIVVEGITIEIIDNLKYDKIRINKN
jgi:hypothetical protein